MEEEIDLTFRGERPPAETPITLSAGWNMIGYTRTLPSNAELALDAANTTSHPDNVIIAKDYLGNAYLPQFNFNGLGDLEPGQGYQLKLAANECSAMTEQDACGENLFCHWESIDKDHGACRFGFKYLPDDQDYTENSAMP